MPYREDNPSPKDHIAEINPLLACFIHHRVLEGVVIIDILLEHKGKETLPGGPHGVVEHRKPVGKVDLPAVAVVESKVNFSENQDHVFVEIVADHPGDPPVAPSAMDQ
jgi:hypothetical protein